MPFLNGIFHSPYFDDFNFSDRRFVPSLSRALYYPFLWYNWAFWGIENIDWPHRIYERRYNDIHMTVYYVFMMFIVLYGGFKGKYKEWYEKYHLEFFLFVFYFFVFFIWLLGFSIVRYAIVLEVLGGGIMVRLILHCYPKKTFCEICYLTGCIFLVFLLVINVQRSSDRNNGLQVIEMEKINLPDNTLVKLYNFPTAAIIPMLSKSAKVRALGYLHLNGEYMKGSDFAERGKFRELRDKIEKEHQGLVIVVYRMLLLNLESSQKILKELEKYKKDMYCRKVRTNLDKGWRICVPKEQKMQILSERYDEEDDEFLY